MDTHCDLGPDDCFGCKCAYWRTSGVPLQFTYGKETFHGPTGRELRDQGVAQARARGIEPEPYHQSNYYGPVKV
jgi:hypothetical protein